MNGYGPKKHRRIDLDSPDIPQRDLVVHKPLLNAVIEGIGNKKITPTLFRK